MANVTLKKIGKVYDGGVTAVSDFNLEIKDKEFIVLVGPSGCGKSTTLRMVAGLEEISSGELYIGDRLVNQVPGKDRDIAMVFQNYALYPHLTVYDNIAFPLKMRKAPKEEIDRKVRAAAETLDITQYLDRRPKALSGGQRQRVAIGRAIVRNPSVFLMDEPLSNLDAKLRNQMRAEIIKLRHQINTTFLYVTHDQTEAMTLGDRIVVMKDGYVQQIGTPEEVYQQPANLFVAGFIGMPQMNFFNGSACMQNGAAAVMMSGGTVLSLSSEISDRLLQGFRDGREITVGIRPDDLYLAGKEEAGLKAAVDVSEMMGSEIHLHVHLLGSEAVVKIPVKQLEGHAGILKEGAEVRLGYDRSRVHLFDRGTGSRI